MDSVVADLEGGASSGSSKKRMTMLVGIAVVLLIAVVALFALQHKGSDQSQQPQAQEQTDSTAQEQTEQAPQQQTEPTDTTQPAAPVDSSADQLPANSKFNDQVKQQMYADLDKMYQPYVEGTSTNKAALKKQVGRYYKGLQKALSPMSDAEQQAFDQAFINYKKQKDAQVK